MLRRRPRRAATPSGLLECITWPFWLLAIAGFALSQFVAVVSQQSRPLVDWAEHQQAEEHARQLGLALLAAGLRSCAWHDRWEFELTIDQIDSHQRLVPHPLRSQKPVGVIQELYGLLLAHSAVRAIMAGAAAQAEVAPTKMSFTQSVELIRLAINDFQLVARADHARLYQRLLRDIAARRLPSRAQRTNPRVVTRKMSKFALKRGKPASPSQHLAAFATTIQVLSQTAP